MSSSAHSVQLRWRHKLLLIGFGIAFALALVEIAARMFGLLPVLSDAEYRRVTRRVGALRPPYEHFTHYGFVADNTEFAVNVRLNKLGFRGDDIPTRLPPGTQRILLMGDSYTAGWEVEADKMWASWLSRWLNTGAQAYEVNNLGFPGFGTDREFLLYQAYGRQLDPDLVVLVIYIENDVSDNGSALWESPDLLVQSRPFFTLDAQGNLVEHPWSYTDKTRAYQYEPFPQNVIGWLNAHSLTYRLVRDQAQAVWKAVAGERATGGAQVTGEAPPHTDRPAGIPLPLEVMFSQPDEKWQAAWRITEALLAAFQAAVTDDDAQFVAVIVPPHMIVQGEHWQYVPLFEESGRPWDRWYPQRRMTAILEELGIPVFNPTQAFIEFRAATGQDPFYPRDRHFSPTGTCLFGTLLANWLVQQGYVQPIAGFPRDPLVECRQP